MPVWSEDVDALVKPHVPAAHACGAERAVGDMNDIQRVLNDDAGSWQARYSRPASSSSLSQ